VLFRSTGSVMGEPGRRAVQWESHERDPADA